MKILSRPCLYVGLGLSAAIGQAAAANTQTTANLLVNGDAELKRCTNDWTAQTSVPGWRVTRGAVSVLCYSAFKLAGENPVTPPGAGNALFGAPGADTAMDQTVDVGAVGPAIDRGGISFQLSGWLGGWENLPERATLTALFLDASGESTGSPVVIADGDARARGNLTALVQRDAAGLVPPGTRRINVTVQFLSGMTSFHNAYADNVRLTLSGKVDALNPAAAHPPAAEVPALDHVYVLMMENTNYADIVRTNGTSVSIDPRMPFTASLARRGVVLSNMWQTYHPSDQNYVAMIAGDTFKYGPVYFPDYNLVETHLGDLLNAHGKSWRAYVQNMKTPCNLESDGNQRKSYSPDDQPFVQFADVIGDLARCTMDNRDLADFESSIAANTLPDFTWIAADNWWDGEGVWYENYDVGTSNAKQDEFLQSTLQPLLQSQQWNESRSLLILTWDEADGWGWPDNHVPTFLIGSPGLLREGTVTHEHVNGYDLLRTVETALGVGTLGRFDEFGRPLNEVFSGPTSHEDLAAKTLWPTEAVATRGRIKDTFGKATVPAAVDQGDPITLVVPSGVDASTVVNLELLGHVPTEKSTPFYFDADQASVKIPTQGLAPGVYGAWLRHGARPPYQAPMMVSILPTALVTSANPGVEILGAASSDNPENVGVREGANLIVRYCLASGAAATDGWIGIFASGTPSKKLTKDHANKIGFWLKTPGDAQGAACGEAEAYSSELTPGETYEVLLFNGASTVVGRSATFTLTPALPH